MNGDTLWTKCLGGASVDVGFYAHQTADKGYIMAGGVNSGELPGWHGAFDSYVVKLDSLKDTVWTKCLGGSDWEQAKCIRETSDGGFVIASYTGSDDGDVRGSHGGDDIWIVKLNSSGDTLWTRSLGGSENDEPYYIMETTDHEYVVAGYTNSDDGDVINNNGSRDAWLVKLKQGGSIRWSKCLGGSDFDEARYIIQTEDGGYIVAGSAGSDDGDVSGNNGERDLWVVKLSADPMGEDQVVINDNPITVYPNPLNNNAVIGFPNPQNEKYKLTVTDASGRIVRITENITGNEYNFKKGHLRKGIYFIGLSGDKCYRTEIIIK